jgi:hypothetical protein
MAWVIFFDEIDWYQDILEISKGPTLTTVYYKKIVFVQLQMSSLKIFPKI